jgi:hypothetical protein
MKQMIFQLMMWLTLAVPAISMADVPAPPVVPAEQPVVATPPPSPIAPVGAASADLRATCSAAMNADPEFAKKVLRVVDDTKVIELEKAQQKFAGIQIEAGARVAKNERHVILAYAAIWLAAAGFIIFLWQRQRALRSQIDSLRSDLASALRSGK